MGFAYNNLKRHEAALESYRQALVLALDDLEARNNFAVTLYYLKRFDEARAEYDGLINAHPDYAAARFN